MEITGRTRVRDATPDGAARWLYGEGEVGYIALAFREWICSTPGVEQMNLHVALRRFRYDPAGSQLMRKYGQMPIGTGMDLFRG